MLEKFRRFEFFLPRHRPPSHCSSKTPFPPPFLSSFSPSASLLIPQRYYESVEYIEDVLRNQLIAAIGKSLDSEDFTKYMDFHNRKLFKKDFKFQPFSYAVRFGDRAPEGMFFF
jgi:hypothetical protein